MQIKVLGCSGGVGPGLRTTSLLVNDVLLIDAGTGACDLDFDAMVRLTHVFLTHSHLDHIVALAFIADNRLNRGVASLEVHSQHETLEALRRHLFNWELWPDFTELDVQGMPVLRLETFDTNASIAMDGLQVSAFSVLHTVPAVGYVLSDAGGCFAFTGDTYADDAMWAALNALPRLDALMIEIAYRDEAEAVGAASKHLTPARLGRELEKLEHRPELLLSHAKPGHGEAIRAQCRGALAGWNFRHLQCGDLIEL